MGKKVTFSLFHRKFENGPFWAHFGPIWPILAQNAKKQRFFAFFSKTAHWNFLIFCTKPSLWSRKKMTVSLFCRKFKNDPFWPKLTQIWPKFGHFGRQKLKKKMSFFFYKNRKKIISGKTNPLFTIFTHFMTSLSPHLENFWNA